MKIKSFAGGLLLSAIVSSSAVFACSRVLVAGHGPAVMVGRNMDWSLADRMMANIWVYPRGMQRSGLAHPNPLRWHSKYGSIVSTSYDDIYPITTDGMNEHGLAAHLNVLSSSNYGERNPAIPGMSVTMWAQYYLDNFKTVAEAVRNTTANAFQLHAFHDPKSGRTLGLHLGIEDASGDSAVIEYIDGQLHVYHGPEYNVMTNDPPMDGQLRNLKKYHGFGGDKPLPGTTEPNDRFVRAAFYTRHLPVYANVRDELTGVFTVIENLTQPAGDGSRERPQKGETVWRTVSDLTNLEYYFTHAKGHNLLHTSLKHFDLHEGAKPMRLIVQERTDLSGDITTLFESVG